MKTARWSFPWLLTLLLASSACQRGDPLDRKVSVPTPSAFAAWRWEIASDGAAPLRRQVTAALLEIRFHNEGNRALDRIMAGPDASPPIGADVDEAIRQRIDGRSLREVLQLGAELRVRRLKSELAGLEYAVEQNAKLVTKPGDLESKHHLEGLRERQLARVAKYKEDLAEAERELAPLRAHSGKSLLPEEPEPAPERIR